MASNASARPRRPSRPFDPETPSSRVQAITRCPCVLAIGSLPLLLLDLVRDDLPHSDQLFLTTVNLAVLVVFAVDYVVELCLARPRALYVRREWTSVLIVISQAIALIPGLGAFGAL